MVNKLKLSLRTLLIIILVAVIVVTLALVMIITASLSDEQRLDYELKADGTYEVVDVKNAYRGGWFAKDTLIVPATHKGKAVTSIKLLNLQRTKTVVIPEGVKSIGGSALYGSSVVSVQLPSTLTSIGNNAFNGCYNLEEINIPTSITSIANGTFKNCLSLKTLEIPNTVTSIGNEVFSHCISLTSLTLPNSVTSIGNSVFDGCTALESITVASGNANYSSVDGILYNKEQTEFLTIPMGIKSANIPSTITSIPTSAFANCKALTSVTLPSSITAIPASAFSGCIALTSISIPASVKSIGVNAFKDCEALTSVTFANTNGWKASTTEISADDLADATTAAELLTDTHVSKTWTYTEPVTE